MSPGEVRTALPQPVGDVPEISEAVHAALAAGGGKLCFARFLEICLYHPARGYYAAFGPETDEHARRPASDYFTSVDLHPAFGHLVAREVALHLQRLAREAQGPLFVVEPGPGRGLLARDILQALALEEADLFPRVRYLLLEPNPGWVAIQRRNLLPEFAGKVAWLRTGGSLLPLRAVRGVFLSNEVFDALPFHLVVGSSEGLREVFVAAPGGEGGALEEAVEAPCDPALEARLFGAGVTLAPGQRGEVCLEAGALALEMARALASGAAVAVDYGDEAGALFDPRLRPEGTLRCFFRHRRNDEPLARLGRQDITAHVDFSALAGAFARGGLRVHRLERQAEFLERHGLDELLQRLERDRPGLAREVYVRHRRALEALRERRGLGGNLVLVAWK